MNGPPKFGPTSCGYLPSDTSFLPINADQRPLANKNFTITSSACLTLFTLLACITERKSISADPFSLTFEVIRQAHILVRLCANFRNNDKKLTLAGKKSAFGNAGYSLGYSCDKLPKPDACCKAACYGFVGWWTDEGKLIITLVMFLGRLKKFILKEENLDSAATTHQIQGVEAARLPTPCPKELANQLKASHCGKDKGWSVTTGKAVEPTRFDRLCCDLLDVWVSEYQND
ncbi:hypothetical protein EJB05_39374, partial [Eragrostis curvula]